MMSNLKRIRAVLVLCLCAALLAGSLAGCAGNTEPAPTEGAAPETVAAPEITEAPEMTETPATVPDVSWPDLSYEGYTLKWEDNFDGETLNRDDWNVELHGKGWVNQEWQAYVDSEENIYLEDGNLVLKPVKETDQNGNDKYTSGRVNTQGKHDFQYGLFEARLKVPTGKGYLPAFWLMATDQYLYGQWPLCGEIDIMEVLGDDTDTSHGTVHYGNPHTQSQGTYELTEGNFSDEYHTFALEWEPARLRWYVDGVLFHEETEWHTTAEGRGTLPYPAPFDQDFYIILNLAIGGSWVGYPDETTTFEDQAYMIDYVRVYQKDHYEAYVAPESNMREPDETGNYVVNSDFAVAEPLDDEEDWFFLTALGGVGSAEIADGQLNITTQDAGTVDYSIQLVQPNMPMERGKTYKLTFDASADEMRTLKVCVSAPNRDWIRYLPDTAIEAGPEKQSYEFIFTMKEKDDPDGRLEFNLGNMGSTAAFHLSNVRLEEIEAQENTVETAPDDGNLVSNGSFADGAAGWDVLNVLDPAKGTITVADGKAVVEVTEPGKEDWNVQMIHYGVALETGCTYELTFKASSTVQREIGINLMSSTYSWYGGMNPVLTPEEQTFTLTFTMEQETNLDSGLFISMGLMASGDTPCSTITLDDFVLTKVSG